MFKEPLGFINSSYLILFHVCLLVCAPLLANTFPNSLGIMPLVVCFLLPMILFWYFWILRNHVDIALLPLAIFGFAMTCGFFALISVLRGPLANGEIAAINVPFIPILNLFFVSYSPTAPLLASMVMYYGALTYLLAAGLSMILEFFYNGLVQQFMPRTLRRTLTATDDTVDRKLFTFMDGKWVMGQNIGALYILLTLLGLAALYTCTIVIL
jgi:hypothetical protein